MAKAKSTTQSTFHSKSKINGKGVHAKKKTSTNPSSKNYSKPYKGQGR
jgi:hypothetical protein